VDKIEYRRDHADNVPNTRGRVMDAVEEAIAAAPATPAGRAAAWCLMRVHSRGEGAGLADLERYRPELAARMRPAVSDEDHREGWRANADRLGAFIGIAYEAQSDFAIQAIVSAAKDRRWKLTLAVETAPPHRIEALQWERVHDFQLEVREATAADAAILADVERRCPIVLDGVSRWFDRGEDYFAFARLMEDATVGLAFVDGAPAAVTCGARHTVRIGGEDKAIITVSHLRVLPEHQRKGLWGAANRVLDKYWPTVAGSNAFIAVDNAGMQHGFRSTPDKWPTLVLAARLSPQRLAGPPHGRPATPADAGAIVGMLNAFHASEEMFVPYTAQSLTARLERAPDLYGWDRLWLTDGAVVGVWPAGRAWRTVIDRDGELSHSDPGVVLDYAFEAGAEGEFEALVRAWCGWLSERGMNRLTILTSSASPGERVLRGLADEVEAFNHWTPGVPPPSDAASKGLYIDPIYF
jgi:flavin reductase (DIM6/NTAB) family NADH-FMN oxidoreductase RutF